MEENPEKNQDQPYPQSDSSELPQPEIAGQPAESPESPEPEAEPRPQTREEAFAEVRQSLREEEQQKKPGFFKRVTDRLLKRTRREQESPAEGVQEGVGEAPAIDWEPEVREIRPAPEITAEPEPGPLPVTAPLVAKAPAPPEVPAPPASSQDEFDNAVDRAMRAIKAMPKEEPGKVVLPGHEEVEAPAEPRHSILTGLRGEGEAEQVEEVESIRQEALEDYSEQPEEPAAETQVSLRQSVRRSWRDMRPGEKRLLISSLVFIVAALLIGVVVLVARPFAPAAPVPTPTVTNLPYPLSISLPGNLVFKLNRGSVQNGKWNPSGPEWLQGTEVCRWVSLPWSVQLEAVLRTLKADDQISLSMNNSDNLVFHVKSIEQVPADQIGSLASQEETCLLVFLSQQDSDTRWVVRAVP